jgi:hypothetical protein
MRRVWGQSCAKIRNALRCIATPVNFFAATYLTKELNRRDIFRLFRTVSINVLEIISFALAKMPKEQVNGTNEK